MSQRPIAAAALGFYTQVGERLPPPGYTKEANLKI